MSSPFRTRERSEMPIFAANSKTRFKCSLRERVRPDQHIHFCVSRRQMMKRAAIRRLGARAIILSNNSVRTLLVSEKEFEKILSTARG